MTVLINLANNSAESSPSLGIVCVFKGETRVLDTIKLEFLPEYVISTKYITAVYAMDEALYSVFMFCEIVMVYSNGLTLQQICGKVLPLLQCLTLKSIAKLLYKCLESNGDGR